MATILYLVHRMPYPPDKGDKVRSYHLLQHLLQQGHRVFVGTFVDDPADAQHLPALEALCAGLHAVRLNTRLQRVASLRALLGSGPLTEAYCADAGLARWVRALAERERIDATLVFSSGMVPYAQLLAPRVPMLLDLVDVDSAKWSAYAAHHRWPLSVLYRREGRTLLALERRAVAAAAHSFLATRKEVELLLSLAPECAGRVSALDNGVDAAFFSPAAARPSPFDAGTLPLVFTGAMDYWPNIDAVTWFARAVLPALRVRFPALAFHIVGRAPAPAVQALHDSGGVVVSGTVPDVRPYLQHAAAVVVPLRLARGIQNKLLEAMAMARPVVAAGSCVAATSALPGREVLTVDGHDDGAAWTAAIAGLLERPADAAALGEAGRGRVLADYVWPAQLAGLDRQLARLVALDADDGASAASRTRPGVRLPEAVL